MYTDQELLEAIGREMSQNAEYRKQLEDAVDSKSSSRFLDLIAEVAKWFFGEALPATIGVVLNFLLN